MRFLFRGREKANLIESKTISVENQERLLTLRASKQWCSFELLLLLFSLKRTSKWAIILDRQFGWTLAAGSGEEDRFPMRLDCRHFCSHYSDAHGAGINQNSYTSSYISEFLHKAKLRLEGSRSESFTASFWTRSWIWMKFVAAIRRAEQDSPRSIRIALMCYPFLFCFLHFSFQFQTFASLKFSSFYNFIFLEASDLNSSGTTELLSRTFQADLLLVFEVLKLSNLNNS